MTEVQTYLHTAPPLWEWPKPRWRSCTHQISRWRRCGCCPGAREPCSSVCPLPWRRSICPSGSFCGTPPWWVCSTFGRWPVRGLQSERDHFSCPYSLCRHNNKWLIWMSTLMWKSLSTKMFSGLRSLWMMWRSERYTMASRISKMILPLIESGTSV